MTSTPTPRSSRVWIVLAAYNEAPALPDLLTRIAEAMAEGRIDYQVILIDDGSQDATPEIVSRFSKVMPLRMERHERNMGLGATIRDGIWLAALEAEPRDVLVTLDADNTHSPDLILRMVRMVKEGHDVVIASRYRPGSRVRGLSVKRRLLSRVASTLLRIVFPTKGVRDFTSGYRAYRVAAIQSLLERQGTAFRKQDGFQVMVDILLELRRDRTLLFGEAPLILRYDLKDGASKMDIRTTIKESLSLIMKRRLRR